MWRKRSFLWVGAIPPFLFLSWFSLSTCLRIAHLYNNRPAQQLPIFLLSKIPEFLTQFASGLCRIGIGRFWHWGVGSGSPTGILAAHAVWRPLGRPAVRWLQAPTPRTFGAVPATPIAFSSIETIDISCWKAVYKPVNKSCSSIFVFGSAAK